MVCSWEIWASVLVCTRIIYKYTETLYGYSYEWSVREFGNVRCENFRESRRIIELAILPPAFDLKCTVAASLSRSDLLIKSLRNLNIISRIITSVIGYRTRWSRYENNRSREIWTVTLLYIFIHPTNNTNFFSSGTLSINVLASYNSNIANKKEKQLRYSKYSL